MGWKRSELSPHLRQLVAQAEKKPARSNAKASDEELLWAYTQEKLGVWSIAQKFNMCGQSVWARLQRMKVPMRRQPLTQAELNRVEEVYKTGIKKGDGKLDALTAELGRTKQFISRKAKELGLSNPRRKPTDENAAAQGKRVSKHFKDNGHPKGFSGRGHSKETCNLIGEKSKEAHARRSPEAESVRILKQLKTREANGTLNPHREGTTWKAAWRTIGGKRKYYRSSWEANYGYYLEFLKSHGKIKAWAHEPDTFWFEVVKRGVRSYLPDFKVTNNDGAVYYVEVKGWMDPKSATKLKRMKKYHPEVELRLVDAKAYKILAGQVKNLIPGWEKN